MKVVFFGTPQFAARILDYLLQSKVDICAVIARPDRPQGRSSKPVIVPTKAVALAQSKPIPVYQPEVVSSPEFAETLSSFQADLFVVVAYGEILKQHVLDTPKLGCINLHASLLPKLRGAAPIQRAIINGESETGVTIMHMVRKMDAGDMIEVGKVSIEPTTTYEELENQLYEVGAPLLLKVIHDFSHGIIKETPQDQSQATLAPKIELEECELNWKRSAFELNCLIRGVNPVPGAWFWVSIKEEKKRLKVFTADVDVNSQGPAGTLFSYGPDVISIYCGHGALHLREIQSEGKKRMSVSEFIRGIPADQFKVLS